MSESKTRLIVTIDPSLAAYAEQFVDAGKADSVSAAVKQRAETAPAAHSEGCEALEGGGRADRPGAGGAHDGARRGTAHAASPLAPVSGGGDRCRVRGAPPDGLPGTRGPV